MAQYIQPNADRVLVKPIAPDELTKGGIIIPDTAKERPQKGTVIAVGEGQFNNEGKLLPMRVKVGDMVFYGKYAGMEIDHQDETHIIIRESDIIAFCFEKVVKE